ncbi:MULTISPECIES: M23 family metallopeptidase [unclassified Arthrobacter]|uniref:M23 family metallopeptidase n=1 Tax=unclassified Arthrobacter TaxID=235627 RepID=UPI0003666225|nr:MULTISPECIES: M23 family metallopeptidase [unclassified Arthrobacter]
MKRSILLAAVLMLPASMASAGPPSAVGPVSAVGPAEAGASATAGGPVEAGSSAGSGAAPLQRAGGTTAAAGPGATAAWRWPLAPKPPVLRYFSPPPLPWLSGHRGVDLGGAAPGADVVSPAAGTVSFVGVVVDRPVITIDHGDGLRSSFEPVDSPLAVGTPVAAGEVVGTVVPGHCPLAACLHWGVRDGEQYVNPLQFVLDLRPSILLPLAGAP